MFANIIFILCGVLVVVVLVVGVVFYIRATGDNQAGKSSLQEQQSAKKGSVSNSVPHISSQVQASTPEAYNTKSYLPYKTISGFVVNLGDCQYRAALEVSSINPSLKTNEENQMIDALFQRYLNSVKFPTRIYIQTREIDNKKILEDLANDIDTYVPKLPALEEYAELYYNGIADLSNQVGNSKQKKKFVIVSYDDAWKLDTLDEKEKEDYAVEQLRNYINIVKSGLEAIGLTTRVLYEEELYEIVYACFHREGSGIVEDIVHGDFTGLVLSGKNHLVEQTPDAVADIELSRIINRLSTSLEKHSELSAGEIDRYNRIINIVDMLRTKLPNKEDDLNDVYYLAEEETDLFSDIDDSNLDALFAGSNWEDGSVEPALTEASDDWDESGDAKIEEKLEESIRLEETTGRDNKGNSIGESEKGADF